MIACAVVMLFFAVVASGPDGEDWVRRRLAARRARLSMPAAKVAYLPSARCRGPGGCPVHPEGEHPCIAPR